MVARSPESTAAPHADPQGSNCDNKPRHQRPEHPEFWDHRFTQGVTPWDAGRVPNAFHCFVSNQPQPLRTLIPGCGSAWEAAYLDQRNWPVCALDFSQAALEAARQVFAQAGGYRGELLLADFFDFEPGDSFTLIYERAFLCALPRRMWTDYPHRMAELLAPGGTLTGYFFIDAEALRGPPFGIGRDELMRLMDPMFSLEAEEPSDDAIGPFAGREYWMVWRRR